MKRIRQFGSRVVRSINYRAKAIAKERYLNSLDRKAGRCLAARQDNTGNIKPSDIILFCCLRNERIRMPFFFEYYKRIGVNHFIIVDNGSEDGLMDVCQQREDVSVYYTEASYRESKFGMLWLNHLLTKHGLGHWNVVVDPDEFLVYPYMETRSLKALASFLQEEKRECFHAVMLDAYSRYPIRETILAEGQNPFNVCPYFDRDGYIQTSGWGGSTWIRGGPRMRVYFPDTPEKSPALNKIPFIKWQRGFHYRMSMHDAFPERLNHAHTVNNVNPTGALFHFKMVASLADKAREEMHRKEHYADGAEYSRYNEASSPEFYQNGVSERYESVGQLIRLGLISAGTWF